MHLNVYYFHFKSEFIKGHSVPSASFSGELFAYRVKNATDGHGMDMRPHIRMSAVLEAYSSRLPPSHTPP